MRFKIVTDILEAKNERPKATQINSRRGKRLYLSFFVIDILQNLIIAHLPNFEESDADESEEHAPILKQKGKGRG